MKIAIVVNPSKKGSQATAKAIKQKLSSYNDVDYFLTESPKFDLNIDYIFVIGGDGTLLRAVDNAIAKDVPIICFNTGKVGFLAEVSSLDEIDAAIERIMCGDFSIEARSLLQINYNGETHYALNDACISKDISSNVIQATVKVGDLKISSFSCDGVLVSTPTGSTAYSLSAGGPILSPDVNAMLLTPVCAHVLFSRPMIFNGSDVLNISATTNTSANINIDGKVIDNFSGYAEFDVTFSDKTLKLIKLHNESFYNKLQKKLLQWTVENNN